MEPTGGPPDDGGAEPQDLLDAVQASILAIVARSPRPPAALRVSAGGVTVAATWPAAAPGPVPTPGPAPTPAGAGAGVGADGGGHGAPDGRTMVCSPTMGAFYRAPSPGAAPFVEVGDVVAPGRQVGVVESMKLFFPVEASAPGRVAEVLKDDGEVVEHGEAVVALEPA